jgi:hypothetical protein
VASLGLGIKGGFIVLSEIGSHSSDSTAKTSNIMTYNQILCGFAALCFPHFIRHSVFE